MKKILPYTAILLIILTIISPSMLPVLPKPTLPATSVILDAKGRVVTTLFKQNRIPVSLHEISPFMKKAIVAAEDERFYNHFGIDPVGIVRALIHDVISGKIVEGGSTISQQLARNLYLNTDKSILRKLKEAYYSILLEHRYSKEEILNMYLNTIYFGEGAYGIEAAARTYFGKHASDLNLAESAILASLPPSPENYSPFENYKSAKRRQLYVLNQMVKLDMISQSEADSAAGMELNLAIKKSSTDKAPYFVQEVIKYFEDNYKYSKEMIYTKGLRIHTTLDLDMQKAAENALSSILRKYDKELNGALVAIDPTSGAIRAMVGGRDFKKSKFNRVYAKKQPGSAFKPFVYIEAIRAGKTAATTYKCEQVTFQVAGENYSPTDFDGGYHNRLLTFNEALAISDNVVAIRLIKDIGPENVAQTAAKMGIKSKLHPYLSLALGTSEVTPLEMASAFGVLASGGIYAEPFIVKRVVEQQGKVLEEHKTKLKRVLAPETAYIVTDMMRGVLSSGGTAENIKDIIDRPAAGKTGTTEGFKDAWFVGFTPELTAAVYVGYDDNRRIKATGGSIAAPIWAKFIKEALKDKPKKDFKVPDNITFVDICTDDGLRASPFSTRVEKMPFVKGTEPKMLCFGNHLDFDFEKSILEYEIFIKEWERNPNKFFRKEK